MKAFCSKRGIKRGSLVFLVLAVSVLCLHCVMGAHAGNAAGVKSEFNVIPAPRKTVIRDGVFKTDGSVPFNLPADGSLSTETVRLALGKTLMLKGNPERVQPGKGLRLAVGDPGDESKSSEAYRLTVERDAITITGRTGDGVLMGLRTLAQLALDGDIPCCEITDWPDMDLRAGHVCYMVVRETTNRVLPNFDALLAHIDRLASLKFNAAVLEMAAMFPYRNHPAIHTQLTFTPEQIETLRDRLEAQHMEVIPLIPSLGHVYHVLVSDEYKRYRETPDKIQQYCPTNPDVPDLYMEFVDEWLSFFPDITRIHIGGDESRQLGQCPRCKAKEEKYGTGRLYADHITEIAERLHKKGLRPMLWHDGMFHMPEAMDIIPKYADVVYWQYFPTQWSNPEFPKTLLEKGYHVMASPGVRFGQSGTELSVYYNEALPGLEDLIPRMYSYGAREIIVTNWMKGSPFESTDYGMAYAGDLCWNTGITRDSFNKRYAHVTFGLDDSRICDVFTTLSLWLPYAEPAQKHMPDRLNRLDHSALRFPYKWARYTDPENEPETLAYLHAAVDSAEKATAVLRELSPQALRGDRQLDILNMSVNSIDAKATFALMLHEGRRLQTGPVDGEAILRWCARQPAVMGAWKAAKRRHYNVLLPTCFKPVVEHINELMFENAELTYMEYMGDNLASRVKPGKRPREVTIPFLDNSGGPYERGYQHGEVFRDEVRAMVKSWAGRYINNPDPFHVNMNGRMLDYVSNNFPYIIEELHGIADGARLDFEDIWWYNIFNAVGRIPEFETCSNVILKAGDGTLHFGKTSDIDMPQRNAMLLRRVRDGGHDFYVLGWYGNVWVEEALTSDGLAVGQDSGPEHPMQDGRGIGQHFGAYPLLFSAGTAKEAVTLLDGIDFAGKGIVYGICDARGDAAIVEKTGAAQGVEWLKSGMRGILGTNDYLTPEMMQYNRGGVCESCVLRRKAFAKWLPTTVNEESRAALKRVLHDYPFNRPGKTLAAAVMSPSRGEIQVTGLPPSDEIWLTWGFGE